MRSEVLMARMVAVALCCLTAGGCKSGKIDSQSNDGFSGGDLATLGPLPDGGGGATVSIGTGVKSGTLVDLPVTYTAGSASVSALQFDLVLPAKISFHGIAGAASLVDKTAQAAAVAGGVRVLIFGVNQKAIGSGPLATVQLELDPSLSGTLAVPITGIVAAGPDAAKVDVKGIDGSISL